MVRLEKVFNPYFVCIGNTVLDIHTKLCLTEWLKVIAHKHCASERVRDSPNIESIKT